jgi:hypothetical protein
MNSPV